MDAVLVNINTNWRFYSVCLVILSFAILYWLSRYFATKKDLDAHVKALNAQKEKFEQHQKEHYQLRDLVYAIDGHVKHLPSAAESQQLREQMARLEGQLEGMKPLMKQLLNNDNMLFENELRGENK